MNAHLETAHSGPRSPSRRAFVNLRIACVSAIAFLLLLIATGVVFALPPVPVPPANPITEPKRVLGKILFWDEQLSTSNTVSCGTCHSFRAGGTEPRAFAIHPGPDLLLATPDDSRASPGVIASDIDLNYVRDPTFGMSVQATRRTTNTVINAAYAPILFWDGRATSQFIDPETGQVAIQAGGALESQAVAPILSSVEMGHHGMQWQFLKDKFTRIQPLALATSLPADVASALAPFGPDNRRPDYPELFRRAFGDSAITARRIAFAIATYERTLISDRSPFDDFINGTPGALSAAAVRGFNAFPGQRCSNCHNANDQTFTNHTFRNIGIRPPGEDLGRQVVTGLVADRGRFKTPTLRNVALKRNFMHNGQFTRLQDVMRWYAHGPNSPPHFPDNEDPLIPGILMPQQTQDDIVAFMEALTDQRVANRTFPFDQPLLFTERPGDQATSFEGGLAGTGGVPPRIIAEAPGLIGNLEFRIGLDAPAPLVGQQAFLAVSDTPPVDGRLVPSEVLGPFEISGSLSTGGAATAHIPIEPGSKADGQFEYYQWLIADAGSPTGEARSAAVRIRYFCAWSGCPAIPCEADFNNSGGTEATDIFIFLDRWFARDTTADFDESGTVDATDIFVFLDAWFAGC